MNGQYQTPANPMVIAGEAGPTVEVPSVNEPGAVYLLTCLLVGGTVEITDLLLARARAWRATMAAQPMLLPAPGDESDADRWRYALIGLLMEGERRLRDNTFWLGNLLMHSAGVAASVTRPITGSWLFAPVRPSLQALVRRGETGVAHLIDQGRLEEAMSRLLTKELTDEMVTLVLAYMGDKPEVRNLIQSQGTSLAGDVVDEVRGRSQTADTLMETVVHRLFGMAPRAPSPTHTK